METDAHEEPISTSSSESPPSIAVVGGGAVGVTTAVDLATRGADVTLFERETLGAGSSGRAAGVLYDAYAEDIDAALATRAMERFRQFDRTLDGFSFTPCPYVIAVRAGDGDADAIPGMVDRMRAHDLDVTLVDPEILGEQFPIETDDLAVAAVAEGAGWTDPESYVAAMGSRARSHGIRIKIGAAVEVRAGKRDTNATGPEGETAKVISDGITHQFDAVVVAVGAHTKSVLANAGFGVPVLPYRVQALVSRRPYEGPMVYDATAGVYCRPHPSGLLAGDGTEPVAAEPDTYERDADDWFRSSIATTLRTRLGYDPVEERAWSGLCTATPDGDPIVGELAPGLFIAAGWQGHGFMRAPAFGELVASGVLASIAGIDLGSPESPWIKAFDPGRFSGSESFEIREGMTIRARDRRENGDGSQPCE